jgi:hypothetical protein
MLEGKEAQEVLENLKRSAIARLNNQIDAVAKKDGDYRKQLVQRRGSMLRGGQTTK